MAIANMALVIGPNILRSHKVQCAGILLPVLLEL